MLMAVGISLRIATQRSYVKPEITFRLSIRIELA